MGLCGVNVYSLSVFIIEKFSMVFKNLLVGPEKDRVFFILFCYHIDCFQSFDEFFFCAISALTSSFLALNSFCFNYFSGLYKFGVFSTYFCRILSYYIKLYCHKISFMFILSCLTDRK